MSLFRGSKNATIVNGEIVATAQDIADAVNDAIAAKNAAETAEAAALNTLDDFDDRYLGAKTSDPSTDNDGDALIDGALYYNTDTNITRVYDVSSSQWFNVKPTATEQTNINTVAGIAVDVETVAADGADIGTVANNIANVTTAADNISNINIVASDLNETVSEIDTVAANITNVNNVGNSIADVNTVADISTEVTIVAADGTDIGDVASNINAVDVVASDLAGAGFDYDLGSITGVTEGVVGTPDGFIISVFNIKDDVQTVAGIDTEVSSVASISSDVSSVSTIDSDVIIVAGISSDVTTVSNIDTNVTTVSGISPDVTNVSGISSDVSSVSNISSDVTEVSSISSDVSAVSNISSDVTTVANNVSDVTNFSDVYIGPSLSEPTTRSDGSPLVAGDLYFDTSLDNLRAYDGASWQTLSSRSDSEIRGLFSAGGDLVYDSATGSFSVTTYKSSDFDTDFSNKTTTNLTEGSNLYYTDARVNARIDTRVDKTFVDALNVDADTLDGQQGTHYLDRANHTGTQTLSTISDSGALAALDEVDTAQIANQAVTDDKLATSLDLGSI